MLRLKNHLQSPPGGFQFQDIQTGWRHHSWSFRGCWGAWYQENIKRRTGRSKEACAEDVETFVCNDLLKRDGWEHWVTVDDIYNPNDIRDLGSFAEREETSPANSNKFAVVFPFCRYDGDNAARLMKWIAELGRNDFECVLSYDSGTPKPIVSQVESSATRAFQSVSHFMYPSPVPGTWAPTIAFRSAAIHMKSIGKSFLWMEADAVPLKREWLEKLQELYWKSGKAFAGPIVPDLGHMNGTGIYPSNTPNRIPGALAQTRIAWDVTMKKEMIRDCFNLAPFYQHAWAMEAGELHPYAGGAIPSFKDPNMMKKIHPDAVIFHRCKDLTLIDRLRERALVSA